MSEKAEITIKMTQDEAKALPEFSVEWMQRDRVMAVMMPWGKPQGGRAYRALMFYGGAATLGEMAAYHREHFGVELDLPGLTCWGVAPMVIFYDVPSGRFFRLNRAAQPIGLLRQI